ncbi:MAG: hypothetical protein WAW63_01530 [Candidatus Saccharimonadales bacterium]|nr:hypothetical protein [Candidatus Saccharibacteria bacterium]
MSSWGYLDEQSTIFHIGKRPDGIGVLEEIAAAFNHSLDEELSPGNISELIGAVGSAKTLQDNIPEVRKALGATASSAVELARGWVNRSGLLIPVDRYFGVDSKPSSPPDLYIITGGVRNWMNRRRTLLEKRGAMYIPVLLAAGNRKMATTEGSDVRQGMTEAGYMKEVIAPKLRKTGFHYVSQIDVDSGDGLEVMRAVVNEAHTQLGDLAQNRVEIVSNAGAWVQNAGQLRRAAIEIDPAIDEHALNISVSADSIKLGFGVEPTSTHQNPLSALGQIIRNFYELSLHTQKG